MTATKPSTLVYMLVRNPCTHDARVLKEADSLAGRGLGVTIVAVQRDAAAPIEQRGSVSILRVPILPLHYRMLRRYRALQGLDSLLARRRRSKRILEIRRSRRRAAQARRELFQRRRVEEERSVRARLREDVRAGRRHPLPRRVTFVSRNPPIALRAASLSVGIRELHARTSLMAGRTGRRAGPRSTASQTPPGQPVTQHDPVVRGWKAPPTVFMTRIPDMAMSARSVIRRASWRASELDVPRATGTLRFGVRPVPVCRGSLDLDARASGVPAG